MDEALPAEAFAPRLAIPTGQGHISFDLGPDSHRYLRPGTVVISRYSNHFQCGLNDDEHFH